MNPAHIQQHARELCSEIENLPASEQQTKVSQMAAELSREVQILSGWLHGHQKQNADAHALFHEPMSIGDVENRAEVDWATIHGPEEDNPVSFLKILREHLINARYQIQKLRSGVTT